MTNNSNNTSNSSSYMAMTNSGAVKRIRTPTASDVLLGRGGGINSHVGNRVFRDWVAKRKEDYNLAGSKVEKTRVAKDVMDLVRAQSPPGRFLQKDPSSGSSGCWVEVDEIRALAKASQALREGAPQIRAAHQGKPASTRKRKAISSKIKPVVPAVTAEPPANTTSITTAAWPQQPAPRPSNNPQDATRQHREVSSGTQQALDELNLNMLQAKSLKSHQVQQQQQNNALPRPLMSNTDFKLQQQQQQQQQQKTEEPVTKRPRFDSTVSEVPPLPPPPILPARRSFGQPPPPIPKKNNDFTRAHSLALSDIETYDNEDPGDPQDEFVNPFLNEDFSLTNPPADQPSTSNVSSENRSNGLVRNVSSDEGREAYSQMGEMCALPSHDDHYDHDNENHHPSSWLNYPGASPQHRRTYSDTDFHDEMRNVMDAVHADEDLTSPTLSGKGGENEDDGHHQNNSMPTLLLPWRGGALKRRYGSNGGIKNGSGGSTPRSISISHILNERQ